MDTSQNTRTTDYTGSYNEIFEILRDNLNSRSAQQVAVLEEQIASKLSIPFSIRSDTKETLRKIIYKMYKKWQKAHRLNDRFQKNDETWLKTPVTIFNSFTQSSTTVATSKRDRPRQSSFEESSLRTQKRMALDISETRSTDELALAMRISLTSAGQLDAAKIVKDITTKSPVRAAKYRAAYRTSMESQQMEMSGDDALVDFIDAKLTEQQYKDIRKSLRQKKYIVYPSYEKIVAAKKLCYPSDITVNETSAEVKLQSLLDHTCSRILKLQTDVITSLRPEVSKNLRLLCKWGYDGSSGHSECKHKFTTEDTSDASVFLTSIVPLQIVGSDNEHGELVIWQNPRPSSPRYCRPIRVQFLKETVVSTNLERLHVENQIASLVPFTSIIDAKEVIVKYELFFTIIDGKVCNSVTATKLSMRNYTSSKFTDIELMKTAAMEDIFNRLLLTSDPYMSSIGERGIRRKEKI